MRRHPLARRTALLVGGIAALLLIVGCVAGAPATTGTPEADVGVTIATAPGETLAFDPTTTTVWAGGPVTLTFQNRSSLSHNLVFIDGLTAATRTIVEPGASDRVLIAALVPGTYPFVCTIHDGMAGSIVAAITSGDGTSLDLGTR